MIRILLFVMMCAFISGCATATKSVGPDGQQVYVIDCSDLGWNYCLDKAHEICAGAGYKILSQDSNSSFYNFSNSFYAGTNREMIIECKR